MRLPDEVQLQARALIASRLGLHFAEGREADLERGLARACRASSIPAPETYLAYLASLPDESAEWRRLAGYLTVAETYFFRDRSSFDALEQTVLPSIVAARRSEGCLRLRLWSAACATGEEPYSLAILLDRLLPDRPDWAVTVLATDINTEALDSARRGLYREWALRETPAWIRDAYFHRRGAERFELDARIRRMVSFAPLNLAGDGYPTAVTNTSAIDLILCRNVLMYFTPDAQRAAADRLRRALAAGGWLVVSPAEASAELFRPLSPVNFPGTIFYRKGPPSELLLPPATWQAEKISLDLQPPLVTPDMSGSSVPSPAEESAATPTAPEPAAHLEHHRTHLERARGLADRGDLEEARRLCEVALAQTRLDPEAHLLLAAICQELGETPAAMQALRRTIYLAPDSAPAHFLLGSLLIRLGKRRQGRRCMETVVSLLSPADRDTPVPGSDNLSAGRLLETARAYLELRR